jgi:ankyrin repeat protein
LHWMSLSGHQGIVELLLAQGADMTAKDNDGKTPLDLATQGGHNDVVELLRKHRDK